MISALEWIPRGVADPTPKKYEWSRAEREFLAREQQAEGEGDDADDADVDENMGGDGDDGDDANASSVQLPKIDPKTLPADLRMDEYSDDEDDGARIGGLLVGKATEADIGGGSDSEAEDAAADEANAAADANTNVDPADDDSDDNESDDDDSLEDAPDTREFTPVDVEGLTSMGLMEGHGADIEDLDSDVEDDEGSLADDVNLRPGDAILVVAKTEEDFASLEINVYDTEDGNLYVHHDIPLPSYPLCLARGDVSPDGTSGNFIAVGSFDKGIEIWNLDVLQALEPVAVLGGEDTTAADDWMRGEVRNSSGGGSKTSKKKKNKKQPPAQKFGGLREGSHSDAVMGLSWNSIHRQVLASASADRTVKLWDVTRAGDGDDYGRPSATLTHHTDKVACIAWHPGEGTVLATGGYDRKLALVDARNPDTASANVKAVRLTADCEALAWDPHHGQYLTAASEDGVVRTWDVRNLDGGPVWSFEPHGDAVSDVSYNARVPGFMVTCSVDKTVALWDCRNIARGGIPKSCGTKEMNVGKLYTASFYPSSPWLLACGGSGNELSIWDMSEETAIRDRFEGAGAADRDRFESAGAVENAVESNDGGDKETDFEEMMAAGDEEAAKEKALDSMSKSKKKKGKKKKKAHRK